MAPFGEGGHDTSNHRSEIADAMMRFIVDTKGSIWVQVHGPILDLAPIINFNLYFIVSGWVLALMQCLIRKNTLKG